MRYQIERYWILTVKLKNTFQTGEEDCKTNLAHNLLCHRCAILIAFYSDPKYVLVSIAIISNADDKECGVYG